VLIQFPLPGNTIGDTIGWFSYCVKFAAKHGCRLTVAMSEKIATLFREAYPEIKFVAREAIRPEGFYATYRVGLFFDDMDCNHRPCDYRIVGLHRVAGCALGVDLSDAPPRIVLDDDTRPITEPYVAGTMASGMAKRWNNPTGWSEVTAFLKAAGYRVVAIDRDPDGVPPGAEDETGDRPLLERARWLRHCEFFVGLGSGLSWLAWACRAPVVLISGFSHPATEFSTPGRVINYNCCNSCWSDPTLRFNSAFDWCPRHGGTERAFECTRAISAHQVVETIKRIPSFQAAAASSALSRASRSAMERCILLPAVVSPTS
jgi:autotransporter strand-loop-strand O-heptosyltransferase